MIRPLVEGFVTAAVATSKCNSELKRSFRKHPRYNKLIDHLVEEANKLPPKMVTQDTLRDVCTAFTHAWLDLVEKYANERMMSEAQKIAARDAQDKAAKQEQIVDDMIEGKEIDAERIVEVSDG